MPVVPVGGGTVDDKGELFHILKNLFRLKIKLVKEADCDEAVSCNIVTGNSTLTI